MMRGTTKGREGWKKDEEEYENIWERIKNERVENVR
jgi:hypothetical protein